MLGCSQWSVAAGESPRASAPEAKTWLLVEQPASWGPKPPVGCGFSAALEAELAAALSVSGVRLQMIRRYGRKGHGEPGPRRVFLCRAARGGQTVWAGEWEDEDDLRGLPWDAYEADEPPPGFRRWDEPLILVCAHGKRDACCALLGRAAAGALAGRFGDQVWETTHTGGHRFAGNAVVLPEGVVFGRLDAENAAGILEGYFQGEIDTDFFRGRAGDDVWTQAAEWFARERLGLRHAAPLTVAVGEPTGDRVVAEVATGSRTVRVALERRPWSEPRPISCGKEPENPGEVVLTGIEDVPVAR